MLGRNSALVLIALTALILTGVALATPVPVLATSDGERIDLGYLPDGVQVNYEYRQSIYDVMVSEEFVRRGGQLELRRVFAGDIRAIEYYRWDTPITENDGRYATVPPATTVSELTIRITANGKQVLRTGDWNLYLLDRFGESVVHVRAEARPRLLAFVQGLHW